MSDSGEDPRIPLAPPGVAALRGDGNEAKRAPMERSLSVDMRREREDLKTAAEQSLNVILDLGLDGAIRWVSESWREVVGTTPESVKGKQMADLLLSSEDVFANAVALMKKDDSKSKIIRFQVTLGPLSVLNDNSCEKKESVVKESKADDPQTSDGEAEQFLNLEGQGIMVYDRTTGKDSHVSDNASR